MPDLPFPSMGEGQSLPRTRYGGGGEKREEGIFVHALIIKGGRMASLVIWGTMDHRRKANIFFLLTFLLLWATATDALAIRSATSLRSKKPDRFVPISPMRRDTYFRALREVAPIPTRNAQVYTTEHFRVIWGNDYKRSDPDWADPDGDGIPTWVEVLADALEWSYDVQSTAGFPDPYGMDQYYLDAYIGNTGIEVQDLQTGQYNSVVISTDYYAKTEIDPDYHVAYFVFNDNFSTHTTLEQSVLRVSAAHELFHAVQRVYYPWDDEVVIDDARWEKELWWFESTCTWMEEICYPSVNDYVTYVKLFLAHPELALGAIEGVREYGAAIFPGFLWNSYGEASIWKAVFENALALGVEDSLSTALTGNGLPPLADVLAIFWNLAAHPEDAPDIWPDGPLFYDAASPKILNGSQPLPFFISTTDYNAPGRYGGNLFRFTTDGPRQAVEMILENYNPGAVWRVGVSRSGSASVEVWAPDAGHPKVSFEAGGAFYMAMVNVSAVSGSQLYDSLFRKIPLSPVPGDLNGNGGVSLEDAIIALQILSGITPVLPLGIEPKDYAVSGAGRVGIEDAVYILQQVSSRP
jgi:hypothetical protein